MPTKTIPSDPGTLTQREVEAWQDVHLPTPNLAGDKDRAAHILKFVQNAVVEWTERTRPLHRRWRGTYHMLQGNTLERGGPEDVHVPELYKALETLVPRIEEAIVENDPWFRIKPRRKVHLGKADTIAAYVDWLYDQANVADLIQPAIRNMIVAQCAAFYVSWDNRFEWRNERTVEKSFDKDGNLKRKVKFKRKQAISYSGPVVYLIDPFDFIIDTKATDPQKAVYVGHRSWMTVDEIRRVGEQQGWMNLDKIDTASNESQTLGLEPEYYSWSRDPTARWGDPHYRNQRQDGRPDKLEVVTLYTTYNMNPDPSSSNKDWQQVRAVIVGGRVTVELRINPFDRQIRPYATARVINNGHEFYGTGPFDNAVRLNQHLDRYHQIFLRAAEVSACPMVFAEEDADLPDSLYKVRPFSVFKGVGPVRFTQVPDGTLRAAPMVLGTLTRNIEEVVGSFRINMGQDTGGTATEATLALQEGNRRTRGLIRALGNGLDQLLQLMYKFALAYSFEDIEFPVLGKRAVELRKTHLNIGPADLLDDVQFDLVGLHSLRNYGLKATGLQGFINSMAPFIVAHPEAVDQVGLMHQMARELIGPDEADAIVKVPTPVDKLISQDEENEGLIAGEIIEVDPDDDDEEHLAALDPLYERALYQGDLHRDVVMAIVKHREDHLLNLSRKKAQEPARQRRMPQQGEAPPEAGGQAGGQGRSSPQAGGFSDQMAQMGAGEPGGQTPGENPGPADEAKYGRTGRASRTVNQVDNQL